MKWILIALLSTLQGSSHNPTAIVFELLKMSPVPRPVIISTAFPDADRSGDHPVERQYSLSELIEGAGKVSEEDGFIKNIEKLEALVDLDWNQAEPLLRRHLNGRQPRIAAFSLAKLYVHELAAGNSLQAETHRRQLKAVVENKQALGRARDFAADALLSTEWKDRDQWYLSLFADKTLRDLTDDSLMMNPLTGPVDRDPDRWIPLLARLVSNPNRTVHDMAVTCLVSFNLEDARRDALVPLLPWLKDPKWSSAGDRLRLIQSMAQLNLRESSLSLVLP